MLTTIFWPWIGFNAFVLAMFALDLEVFQRNFSTLKRAVKGQCSRRPQRESIPPKPEKVKWLCSKEI